MVESDVLGLFVLLHDFPTRVSATGAAHGQDPTPRAGGGGGLYRPGNGCTEQWFLWVPEAPKILF